MGFSCSRGLTSWHCSVYSIANWLRPLQTRNIDSFVSASTSVLSFVILSSELLRKLMLYIIHVILVTSAWSSKLLFAHISLTSILVLGHFYRLGSHILSILSLYDLVLLSTAELLFWIWWMRISGCEGLLLISASLWFNKLW